MEFISWSGGLALELFLQKNAIKKIQICFSSLDIFGLAPLFRKTCENKSKRLKSDYINPGIPKTCVSFAGGCTTTTVERKN